MNVKKDNILILVNDRRDFLISIDEKHQYNSMNVNEIIEEFEKLKYSVNVQSFSDFDPDQQYNGVYILYHITEDPFVIYKSYVEDIINFLRRKGAVLLPCCDYARAHHNKVYMELLRSEFRNEQLKTVRTHFFGNAEEAVNAKKKMQYPVVIKISNGAGSYGVVLAHDEKEFEAKVKKLCRGRFYKRYGEGVITYAKRLSNLLNLRNYQISQYYEKIIAQTFIPKLDGDYKVLYFGGKYYTLKRLNRKNDFRASGSGRLFPVPDSEVDGLLDFAAKVVEEVDFTVMGLDIGFDGSTYHLIEFQFIHLGPYTLSFSEYYHVWNNGRWEKIMAKSNLEKEFCRSIDMYIKGLKSNEKQ